MYLLRYTCEIDHGNGPGIVTREESYSTRAELLSGMSELQSNCAEARHYWDHHYAPDSPWRPKEFKPYAWNIRVYEMKEVPSESFMVETQGSYDREYNKLEARRLRESQESEDRARKDYEKLKTRFEGATP
jgi:hypothetical protein